MKNIKGIVRREMDKLRVKAEMVEPAATAALAGVAEDRTSKIIVGAGAAAMVVSTVVGSKFLAISGGAAFTYGFVRGFRKAMGELGKECA